jgi:hypothetical protein
MALDSYLAVGILRMENGLDYSNIIEDKDAAMISALERKDEEEKEKRKAAEGGRIIFLNDTFLLIFPKDIYSWNTQ